MEKEKYQIIYIFFYLRFLSSCNIFLSILNEESSGILFFSFEEIISLKSISDTGLYKSEVKFIIVYIFNVLPLKASSILPFGVVSNVQQPI